MSLVIPTVPDVHSSEVARVGLETIAQIADRWQLTRAELATLLGVRSTTTVDNWRKKTPERLSPDTLERISYLLHIYRSLQQLVGEDGDERFNTDAFGCFYAARELETSVAETVYHQERFLRDAGSSSSEVPMRVLRADIAAEAVLDLFDVDPSDAVYDPEHHDASQALGTWAHEARLDGIHYRSVRRPPHPCLALYVPSRIVRCVSAAPLAYRWDGERIRVEKRTPLEW